MTCCLFLAGKEARKKGDKVAKPESNGMAPPSTAKPFTRNQTTAKMDAEPCQQKAAKRSRSVKDKGTQGNASEPHVSTRKAPIIKEGRRQKETHVAATQDRCQHLPGITVKRSATERPVLRGAINQTPASPDAFELPLDADEQPGSQSAQRLPILTCK